MIGKMHYLKYDHIKFVAVTIVVQKGTDNALKLTVGEASLFIEAHVREFFIQWSLLSNWDTQKCIAYQFSLFFN